MLHLTPSKSFDSLRRLVHDHIPDDEADRGRTFSLDMHDRQLRFWCPVHEWVVPLRDRHDCPYCMPVLDTDPKPRVTAIERSTGMVVLNPS